MSPEGLLRIDLTLRGGRIRDVAITSTRAVRASRIFHGRDTAAVTTLMPRLFSVCGTAQACAAAAALAAARGHALTRNDLLAGRLLLMMESAQEHAWRLAVDGARLAGEPPRMPVAAGARALLGDLHRVLYPDGTAAGARPEAQEVAHAADRLNTLLAREFFGMAAEVWARRVAQERRWWEGDDAPAARLLRVIAAQGLAGLGSAPPRFLTPGDAPAVDAGLAADNADAFIAAPALDDTPRETTPLARQWDEPALAPLRESCGAGLATRFTALLLELALIPQQMRDLLRGVGHPFPVETSSAAPGIGVARVQAARGLLVHRVELAGDTVARYQILAPTEWNFHPRGSVAASLHGVPVRDAAAARKVTELVVQAIDPCVGFEVTAHA